MIKTRKFWLWVLAVFIVLYSGLWFGAAWFVKKEVRGALASQENIDVQAEQVAVKGFPLGFFVQLQNVVATPKDGALPVETAKIEQLRAGVRLFSPTTVRVNGQGVEAEKDAKTINITELDVVAKRGAYFPVIDMNMAEVRVTDANVDVALFTSEGGTITTRSLKAGSNALDPFAEVAVDFGKSALHLPSEGAEPLNLSQIHILAQPKGTAPFSLNQLIAFDLAEWAAAGGFIEITESSEITLDNSNLKLSGLVGFDNRPESALPDGSITVTLENYPKLIETLDRAKVLELIPEGQRGLVAPGLDSLASMLSGSDQRLTVPIGFHAGKIWAGPRPM